MFKSIMVGVILGLGLFSPLVASAQENSAQDLSSFLSSSQSETTQPESRLSLIQNRHLLKVCIWPEYYSITYRDPRTQKLSGLDIDLARELAQELKVDLEFVDSSFSQLVSDLTHDRCDVAMCAVGINPERQKQVDFTQPYLASDIVAITTRTNRRIQKWADLDQPGNVLAVGKGTWHEPVMEKHLKHAELIVADFPETRENEVLSGRADAFLSDFPYSLRMLETTDWAQRIEPESSFHMTYYAWAIKPGDAVWLERLNQFIQSIKEDGRLLEAAKKHRLEPAVVLESGNNAH